MTDFTVEQPKERPTFLTVLCILSWITAIWTSIGALISVMTKQNSIDKLLMSKDMVENAGIEIEDEGMSFLSSFMNGSLQAVKDQIDNFMLINTSNLVLYGAKILAVFFMFKLLKKGFWLYVFVQVLLLILPFVYMTVNSVMILGTVFTSFITLAFIIMYATNLKHMK
mgnify:CR=1 FL=1